MCKTNHLNHHSAMPEKTFRFTLRSLAALLLLLSLIALPVTAIGMEIAREGHELAHVEVKMHAGEVWAGFHQVFGLIFVISGICHAILNRRQILAHIKGAIGR